MRQLLKLVVLLLGRPLFARYNNKGAEESRRIVPFYIRKVSGLGCFVQRVE